MISEWLESQRAETGSSSYAHLNFTDQLAMRLVVNKRFGHVGDPEGRVLALCDTVRGPGMVWFGAG